MKEFLQDEKGLQKQVARDFPGCSIEVLDEGLFRQEGDASPVCLFDLLITTAEGKHLSVVYKWIDTEWKIEGKPESAEQFFKKSLKGRLA